MTEMKPMDAWKIVSENLHDLYQMRHAMNPRWKGYTDREMDAETMVFHALQQLEKQGNDRRKSKK